MSLYPIRNDLDQEAVRIIYEHRNTFEKKELVQAALMNCFPRISFCQSLIKDCLEHVEVFSPLLMDAIGACSLETFNSLKVALF